MSEPIEFEVIGGMCRIQFRIGSSCGCDPDSNPGVAFTVISDVKASERNGKFHAYRVDTHTYNSLRKMP